MPRSFLIRALSRAFAADGISSQPGVAVECLPHMTNSIHTMMSYPLTLVTLLDRAGTYFSGVEVVSRLPDRSIHRTTWGGAAHRARRLAESLQAAGVKKGDRVATLMWNHHVHLEAHFGVPPS